MKKPIEGARPQGPPEHLSGNAKRWWQSVFQEFELDHSGIELISLAAEALHLASTARDEIERDGLIVVDRFGQQKPHPAIAIERDSSLRFAKLASAIGLLDPLEDTPTGKVSHA